MNDPKTGLPLISLWDITLRLRLPNERTAYDWLTRGAVKMITLPKGYAVRWDDFMDFLNELEPETKTPAA